jgi:hypothetical protein
MTPNCLLTNDPLPWLDHGALFAGDNDEHRFWLTRKLREGEIKPAIFGLHNPSTADASINDPTVRRGIGFGIALDASHLVYWNPCSLRATNADDIPADAELSCPQNWLALDAAFKLVKEHNGVFICAWGKPKGKAAVRRKMEDLFARTLFYAMQAEVPTHALRITGSGYPEHPLYLPAHLRPEPYDLRDQVMEWARTSGDAAAAEMARASA